MISPWWEKFPGRLEAELAGLAADGIVAVRDEAAYNRGVLRLTLTLPEGRWRSTSLVAVFPESYPFFPPAVLDLHNRLGRHQNPFRGNLCLLGRSTSHWRLSTTLAELLASQLPILVRSLGNIDLAEATSLEDPQGEPITAFLDYERDSVVIVDSDWELPTGVDEGVLSLRLLENSENPFRAEVATVLSGEGRVLARAPFGSEDAQVRTRWIRTDGTFPDANPSALLDDPLVDEALKRCPWHNDLQCLGLVFDEEVGHRVLGTGWAFIVRRRGNAPGFRKKHHFKTTFVRAARLGISDLSARFPAFRALQDAKIAVVGAGCLGAPSILEFAKGGVGEIRILEPDIVDAGTIVRWPLGRPAIAREKARVLLEQIRFNYPWVKTIGCSSRLGLACENPQLTERKALATMLDGVDLLFDATAEPGIQYFLAEIARSRSIPYVSVDATRGGLGGTVLRLKHEGGACWGCLQLALEHGDIGKPPEDEDGSVQPAGCEAVTYVGSHFDLQEVALQGVRLAMASLCGKYFPAFGNFEWDVGVLSMRDAGGQRTEPRWSVFPLKKYADCPVCNR